MGKIVFPDGLVVCVGQACNLKCLDCGNLAPYADNKNRIYPLENILESLELLKEIVTPFECLQIQGGEPFLYKELPALVEWCVNSNLAKYILIATNGLFHPEKVDYLQNDKIHVRISNYYVNSANADKSEHFYKDNGINVTRYNFVSGIGDWFKTGRVEDTYNVDVNEAAKRFKSCQFNVCLTLENKKLVYCSRAVNSEQVIGFEAKQGDYVLVSKGNPNLEDELRQYMAVPHYMEACRYCFGTVELCKAGVQPSDESE